MIRAVRATLIFLAAAVAVVVLCAVVLWLAVTRSEYSRDWVAAAAARSIGAPVRIDALDVQWDQGLVFDVHGIRVPAADGGDDALAVERLRLRLRSAALRFARVEIAELEMRAPTLRVATHAEGYPILDGTTVRLGGMPRGALSWELDADLRVRMDNGSVQWRGPDQGAEQLHLRNLTVLATVADGEGDLVASAELGEEGRLSALVRLDGGYAAWRASIDDIDMGALSAVLPAGKNSAASLQLDGLLAARADGVWRSGETAHNELRLSWDAPMVGYADPRYAASADRLRLSATLSVDQAEWAAEVRDLEVTHGVSVWVSPAWQLTGKDRDLVATAVGGMELSDVRRLVVAAMPDGPVAEWVLATAASGWITTARLVAGNDIALEADMVGISSRSTGWVPGVDRAAGQLRLHRDGGEWTSSTEYLGLSLPRLFRQPLDLGAVTGGVSWRRTDDGWRVVTDDARLASEYGRLTAVLELDIPSDRPTYPDIRLTGEFESVEAGTVSELLPVGVMPADAVTWLDRALLGGVGTRGTFRVEGPARAFPFGEAEGEFTVDAELDDVELAFSPDWPSLEGGRGRLEIRGTALDAYIERATLAGIAIDVSHVSLPNLRTPTPMVLIDAGGRGPMAAVVEVLSGGPLPFAAGLRAVGLTGSGEGSARLSLSLPIREPEALELDGMFEFHGAALRFASGIELESLEGGIEFTQGSVSGGPVRGRMLGGPVRIDVSTPRSGREAHIRFHGEGQAEAGRLDAWSGELLANAFDGVGGWQGVLDIEAGDARLEVRSDLLGVVSLLPAPLAKSADTAWPMIATFSYSETESIFALDVDERVHMLLGFIGVGAERRPNRGAVRVGGGRASLDQASGMVVTVDAPAIDADGWWQRWRGAQARASQADEGEQGEGLALRLLEAQGENVAGLGRNLGRQALRVERLSDEYWRGQLDGMAASGAFQLDLGAANQLDLDLDHLRLPPRASEAIEGDGDIDVEPTTLPALVARVGDLVWENWQMGALRIEGGPDEGGWRARQILMRRPELDLRGQGYWRRYDGQAATAVEFELDSRNLGETLQALGYGRQMHRGRGRLTSTLSWGASPPGFSIAAMDGTYTLVAEDGQLLSVDPGVGRLVGLFNAEAIFRRLTLDFTDVFGRGLAFDRIDSTGYFSSGQLHFADHRLIGPAALIDFTGYSDLTARLYDIEMTVAPTYGGNLTMLLTSLASPAAGAAMYLAQRVFQRQFRQLVRSRYRISGSWEEPVVVPLGRVPAETATGSEPERAPTVGPIER